MDFFGGPKCNLLTTNCKGKKILQYNHAALTAITSEWKNTLNKQKKLPTRLVSLIVIGKVHPSLHIKKNLL